MKGEEGGGRERDGRETERETEEGSLGGTGISVAGREAMRSSVRLLEGGSE